MSAKKKRTGEKIPDFINNILKLFDEGCVHIIPFNKTIFILKYRDEQLKMFEGALFGWSFHLEETPFYPLLRLLIEVFPQTDEPFMVETFFDVAGDKQYQETRALLSQENIDILFFNDENKYQGRIETVMTEEEKADLEKLSEKARELLNTIPSSERDFEKAKQYFFENE